MNKCVCEKTANIARQEWIRAALEADLPLFDYRYNHTIQVVNIIRKIGSDLEAKLNIAVIAAWLHDIGKPGLQGKKNHAKRSAEKAIEILKGSALDSKDVERVADAIEKHAGLSLDEPLVPIEAQLLWEADKLSKLGATGIVHYIINGIRLKPGMSLYDISKDLSDFMSLAEDIAESMRTEKAKELANERLKTMKSFVESLKQEVQRREE